jgi:hypothetical protein
MPKDKKQEAGIRITIKSSMNGFVVEGCPAGAHPMGEDISYVYKSMDEVIKNLPSIYSVLEQREDKPDEEEIDNMEKELNKEEYGNS